ncbi:hypothetical protein RZ832_000395 [Clostridioides difficile]|nr:hypothetical protein [Clostridioides difficile]
MDTEVFKLLFCVAAFGWIVYMAFKEKLHKQDPKAFKFLALIFVGLLLAFICFIIPGGAKYTFVLVGVTMGGMTTKIFYQNIKSAIICNEAVNGIYQGYSSYHSGTVSSYAPIFKYKYNGQTYVGQCSNTYSFKKLDKEMVKGNEYQIYINPQIPSSFVLNKRVGIKNVLCLMFGIMCIFIGLSALFV